MGLRHLWAKPVRSVAASWQPRIELRMEDPLLAADVGWPKDLSGELWAPSEGAVVRVVLSETASFTVEAEQVVITRSGDRITGVDVATGPFARGDRAKWCEQHYGILQAGLGTPSNHVLLGTAAGDVASLPWYWKGTPSLRVSLQPSFDELRPDNVFLSFYWGTTKSGGGM
jgi:hypothetical protein